MPENQRKPQEQLTLHITVNSADGDKVRINLPLPLVKLALKIGIDVVPQAGGAEKYDALKQLDLGKLVDLAERGILGKIVEVESADGDFVEVVVE